MTTFRKLPTQAPTAKATAGKNHGRVAASSAKEEVMLNEKRVRRPAAAGRALGRNGASGPRGLLRGNLHDRGGRRRRHSRPDFERFGALVHEHRQAVGMGQAEGFG